MKYLALSGGVGGAKLALGLSRVMAPEELLIVANTGDDFTHLGMHVAPDLDSVMYTLAGLNNTDTGWGRQGETWQFMNALGQLGGETWFKLGDLDLATHVERTRQLNEGLLLSEVTTNLCEKLGITARLQPMTDDLVSTMIQTASGTLAFQHYFVREQCKPVVKGFHFNGIEAAMPLPAMTEMLNDPELDGVIICPSNPFVSIDPILSLPGVYDSMKNTDAPIIAVSPIVGGQALKGPAAKMMQELKLEVTPITVAKHYAGLLSGFVLDKQDDNLAKDLRTMGLDVLVTNTVMETSNDKIALAQDILDHFGIT